MLVENRIQKWMITRGTNGANQIRKPQNAIPTHQDLWVQGLAQWLRRLLQRGEAAAEAADDAFGEFIPPLKMVM